MSQQSSIYQYDGEQILEEIIELTQLRNDWNGFRTKSEIRERFEEGAVSWVHKGGSVVCASTYNHRQTSHTRVYTTAMAEDNWYPDMWMQMITGILLESPHDRIISKTPVDSSEGELWDEIAVKLREENGLFVWEVIDETFLDELRRW